MRRILLITAMLFATNSIAIESDENETLANSSIGGFTVQLTNLVVTAQVVHSNTPFILVSWDNSHRFTGNLPYFIIMKQYLLRSNSNNGYDTLLNTMNIVDTNFLDTTALVGVSYHYRLIRNERITPMVYSNLSDTVTIQTVNVPKLELQEERHRIYPNPSNTNYVVLDYDTEQGQNDHLLIYSATGMLVSQQKLTDGSLHRINISNLKSGTYFYQIRGTMGKIKPISGKLVVQ